MSKSKNVIDFRKRIKIALVEAFGNQCQCCKNSYPVSVYDFHHLIPEEKNFSISGQGVTHSKDDVAKEAEKCIMVCANCHRLIEYEQYSIQEKSNFNKEIYYKTLESLIKVKSKEKTKYISNKPLREILKQQIRILPFLQIGKIYGVSDNAIRKWCKSYNLPSRVSDIKKISDEDWVNI